MSTGADETWRRLVNYVMESRDDWRRAVQDATGIPFGRARLLRRLEDGPLTLAALAAAAGSDAPAATVNVNALEEDGLVVRKPHPTNRRAKLVSLTADGRAVLAKIRKVADNAPAPFATAAPGDLAALRRILDALESGR